MPLGNAHDNAECRRAESGANQRVVEGQRGNRVCGRSRAEVYGWCRACWSARSTNNRGRSSGVLIRCYLSKVTGLSLPPIAHLIQAHAESGVVEARVYRRRRFATKYMQADIGPLAEVDRAHERLSGPATLRISEWEYLEFGKTQFARLAEIAVAHLYNLRGSVAYRKVAVVYTAERRRPEPHGQPGYLRVDTVHQGD